LKTGNGTNSNNATALETSNTPSLVLKRLQQRRAREKGSSNPPPSHAKTSSDSNEANNENKKTSRRSFDGDSDSGTRTSLANGDYGPKLRRSNSNSSGGDSSRGRGGAQGKLSPDTMGEEMRQLDAIANASSGQLSEPTPAPATISSEEAGGGRRRSVKQPVSYAEPALNTKLRRGHDFFPKKEENPPESESETRENGTVQIISPTSGPEMVDEDDLNPLQTTSAEDVLKDLADNATALKI